jgi:glyoxylase-like metal-dependent hydrolase (beta-lactamase superfamily II)
LLRNALEAAPGGGGGSGRLPPFPDGKFPRGYLCEKEAGADIHKLLCVVGLAFYDRETDKREDDMKILEPTRRDLMKLAALAPAMAFPLAARAQFGVPEEGNPAHFRFTMGEAKLTVISDGYFTTPVEGIGIDTDPEIVKAFMKAHYLPEDRAYAHTNHLYIELGDAKVLVDVGSGDRFFDTTGRLMENMEAAGLDPQEVTHVVMTHAHGDHILGIRDGFDEAVIPDAEYIIGEVEHDYWLQDDLVNRVAPDGQQFVLAAVNSINTDGIDWTLAGDGHEVAPGVTMMRTPGHTDGHMSIRVESGGKSLIALGDCLTNAHASFAHPEWKLTRDVIKDVAVDTRKRMLDMAAEDRIAVLGYHFPFPGVGHVARDGGGYRFIPALWRFAG